MFLYPEMLELLEISCARMRRREIGLQDLQRVVSECEEAVTAFQHRDFRQFLQGVEGDLESIQYAVSDEHRLEKADIVLGCLEEKVRSLLRGSDNAI